MNRGDLVVLAADKDMEHALRGMLNRPMALGIRALHFHIIVHPQHDPACARRGVSFLSHFGLANRFRYALLVFDHDGSGCEGEGREALQNRLNDEFRRSPWDDRARAIVLAPELEVWVWSKSRHVEEVAGWKDRQPSLWQWLTKEGWIGTGEAKPGRPKEAFHAALRVSATPRSASLYLALAERVSLSGCQDEAFLELRKTLRTWFPQDEAPTP